PNPFNPSTKIKFALRNDRVVLLNVYDVLGIRVATLFDGKAEANKIYEVEFDATELSSGIYIYRLESDSFFESRKMLLVK
ncbi:MAG: T9SS type A sorting domain-containing protein, partial [Ignavibacteriaceae bacterium]